MLTDDELNAAERAAAECAEIETFAGWTYTLKQSRKARLAPKLAAHVAALVAEIRRLKGAMTPGPASTSMLSDLSRMTGERFGRATLTGAGSQ
jgi:hypothetical protein